MLPRNLASLRHVMCCTRKMLFPPPAVLQNCPIVSRAVGTSDSRYYFHVHNVASPATEIRRGRKRMLISTETLTWKFIRFTEPGMNFERDRTGSQADDLTLSPGKKTACRASLLCRHHGNLSWCCRVIQWRVNLSAHPQPAHTGALIQR